MKRLTMWPLCGVMAGAFAFSGCDDAASPAEATVDASGEDASASSPEVTPEDATEAPGDVATEAPDTAPPAPPYPEGPYGINNLDTIANESFYDPAEDRVVRLSDFYLNPDVVGLVIVSSAGWCTACSLEAWELVEVQERYRDDGLKVLYTLYEDAQGRPLMADPEDEDAMARDKAFALDYATKLGSLVGRAPRQANFPVLIDAGHTLGSYFDANATPMTVVVRTLDMRIENRMIGYSQGAILTFIRGALF
jgi:hypothetical protein